MDTEFPGVVARPITDQYATDYQYQVHSYGYLVTHGSLNPDLDTTV